MGIGAKEFEQLLATTRSKRWRIENQGPKISEIGGIIRVLALDSRGFPLDNPPNAEETLPIAVDRVPKTAEVVVNGAEGPIRLDAMPCPPRFATLRLPERATYGKRVAEIAEELGTPLMPWQRYVADVALEVDTETGNLAYRDVVLTVPRQSGKTTLLLAIMVQRALATQAFGGPQTIDYTAQNRLYARKKWEDEHVVTVMNSAFAELCRIRKSAAMEAILWENGSRHQIISGTETSAHGEVLDLGVIDEAFAQRDFRLEQALKPAMQTRAQAQLWIVSTAGDARSTFLRAKVEAGRELSLRGQNRGICYFEWSAEEGSDSASVETWKRCMPALKHADNPRGTTAIDTVMSDFASMDLPEFKRAYLNLWDTRRGVGVISDEEWALCLSRRSRPIDPVALAFDISPDHRSGAICAAGVSAVNSSAVHVEVVDHRSGTSWMVDRIVELCSKHKPSNLICDAASPAGSLVASLENAGLEVTLATTRDHIYACGAFFQGVTGLNPEGEEQRTGRRIVHTGQPELAEAIAGSDRRQVNDAWLWTRRTSNTDISPLVAATLACYGHETAEIEEETNPALSVW